MRPADITVDLAAIWKPYDRQARFVTSDALFSLFLGGVGSGKSHALSAWIVRKALQNGSATGALLGRTGNDLGSVLLPALFERLRELQDATGINFVRSIDRGNATIRFTNGGVLLYRPYNRVQKLAGLTLTYAGCDEVEFSEADPEDVWSVLNGRLRGKGPAPGLAFATSPNGLRGITKRFHDAQLRADDAVARQDAGALAEAAQYQVVTASSFDNPYLPAHFFDSLRALSRRRFRQDVLGQVLRPMSAVFDVGAHHVIPWDWQVNGMGSNKRRLPWVCGVDWGTQGHHVAVACHIEASGRWVVADELVRDDMPRGRFLDELFKWVDIKGPPVLFGVDRAVPDCNQPLSVRYSRTPVRWLESKDEQRVTRGLEAIRDMLDPYDGIPRLVFSRSLPALTRGDTAGIMPALRGYRYVQGADGIPTTKPQKDNVNDHAIDALRYAVTASSGMLELHGGKRWIIDTDGPRRPDDQGAGHSRRQT